MVSLALPAAGGRAQLAKVAAALAESPRFLILDFRQAMKKGRMGGRPSSHVPLAEPPCTSQHRLQFLKCSCCPGRPWGRCLLLSCRPACHALLPACRRVLGVDATAARSFVTLHSKLQRMGIQVRAHACVWGLGWVGGAVC